MSEFGSANDPAQGTDPFATSSHPSDLTLTPSAAGAEDRDIPDVIVSCFQELDLSASALLYSTETTREDAWFTAVMAGLGEKAEHYEKVGHYSWVFVFLG